MTVNLEFREQHRIIYLAYEEPWSIDEMQKVNQEAVAFLDQAGTDAHVLINVANIRSIPPGILRARSIPTLTHPKCSSIVIVGANALIQILSETIFKMTRFDKAKFFESESDAMQFLSEKIAHGK